MREAYICEPVRTPVGRFGGSFRELIPAHLGATVVRGLLERTSIPPDAVDDVLFAQCYPSMDAPALGRVVALDAGLPIEVGGLQIDRRCGSGLQAIIYALMQVESGASDEADLKPDYDASIESLACSAFSRSQRSIGVQQLPQPLPCGCDRWDLWRPKAIWVAGCGAKQAGARAGEGHVTSWSGRTTMKDAWKRFRSIALSVAVSLATALTPSPSAAQSCEVKIGAVGPLSGGASGLGLSAAEGTKFAAAVVNAEGGLPIGGKRCLVRVVDFDAKYTPAGGAAAANYLASENVRITMGPVGSPETTGFRPVAKRVGIVNFSSSYMRDVITPEFPLTFHALQAPVTWAPLLTKAARDQFKFDTVLIVAPNDQGGTDAGKQFVQVYAAAGVKPLEEYYQRGTTNFAPLAARIMNINPQAIEISTVPPGDGVILVKQLMEAGYTGVIGALGGVGLKSIVEGAGGVENLKNVYWLEVSPVDHPGIVKLRADYKAIMGKDAPDNPLFAVFALATEVALKAVANAGTDADAEKIADALRSLTPESRYMGKAGWRGKSLYGINQELTFPPGIGMIVNGERKTVKTVEIPTE